MTVIINGTTGISSPEVVIDNTSADGGQTVLKSSGFSDWNLDNYNGRLRAYNGSTERMTIDTSGNVGIGTSSPTSTLSLANSTTPQIDFYTGAIKRASIKGTSSELNLDSLTSSPLTFSVNSTERMRIDSSGSLLLGTTSSFFAGYRVSILPAGSADGGIAWRNFDTATSPAMVFGNSSSSVVGSISVSNTATAYLTSSDYRLKENIAPMTGALATVAQLKPVTYSWKADGSDGQGFIAHELQAVVPDCVTGEKDAVDAEGKPQYQGIDTSFLVATLTAAIQELKAQLDESNLILTSVKTELDTVKAEVTALKGTA